MKAKSNKPLQASLTLYHGSGCVIDQFDYAFTGIGNDQLGSGFYFTSELSQALGYTERTIASDREKPGGMETPTVHVARVRFDGLIDDTYERSLRVSEVLAILRAAPNLEEALWNFGDLGSEPRDEILGSAARTSSNASAGTPLIRTLFMLANDFFRDETKAFNEAVKRTLGIDGVVTRFADGSANYVVFTPEQITITGHLMREQVFTGVGVDEQMNDEARSVRRGSHPRIT